MSSGKIGVLLLNLGTPDAPTPKAIRAFLSPFLSEHRVIDLNPLLWRIAVSYTHLTLPTT